jgi:DNA polymerase-4
VSRRQLDGAGRSGGLDNGAWADDTGCTVLHVDMDAFFASVELVDRPELHGLPVIVGGQGRSVVLSATYEARRLGIHSAMPMSRARRLCPQAVVVPPTHGRYAEVSRRVMEIFESVTPLVEPLSLDEAFLDVAGAVRRLGPPVTIARSIRERVAAQQRITCSVGVAATKLTAKIASGRAKPDGLLVVPRAETVAFLHRLPVGALWGVGERTEEALARLGLRTVSDVAHTPVRTLRRALGTALGSHLHDLSRGVDPRPVVPHQAEKSIGAEETFARDADDPAIVRRELLHLCERVAARLRSGGTVARTVTIKIRYSDFTTITRSRTRTEHTDVAYEIYGIAEDLYRALGEGRARVRLVGVRVDGLVDVASSHRQLALDSPAQGWREVEQAMDRAGARFGPGAVRPATLVSRGDGQERAPAGGHRQEEHPGRTPRSGASRTHGRL